MSVDVQKARADATERAAKSVANMLQVSDSSLALHGFTSIQRCGSYCNGVQTLCYQHPDSLDKVEQLRRRHMRNKVTI